MNMFRNAPCPATRHGRRRPPAAIRTGTGCRGTLLAVALLAAAPSFAQMPTQQEMDEAMREMREQMEKLTPAQPPRSPGLVAGCDRRCRARAGVDSSWIWSAGASASVSGGFSPQTF